MTNDNQITLRQGLEQFRATHEVYLSHSQKGVSPEAQAFFASHDIAHVLFGCDISLFGEGSVKMWTIFGTTLGLWKHLKGYQEANAFELSKEFGLTHILRNIFKFLVYIPILIIRAKRMHKPWPWSQYEVFLDTPIDQIRREFNIQII